MARTVEEIMTRDPRTVNADDPIVEAARIMRDGDIGDAIVLEGGEVGGIVTDRDIVVRGVAEGRDAESTSVSDVYTSGIEAIEPGASVDDALRRMRAPSRDHLPRRPRRGARARLDAGGHLGRLARPVSPDTPDKGDRSRDPDPHHALNNPVGEPDETEWPDPYEQREDPRDEEHPATGSTSTSEPHPSQDPEAEPWEGPKRDKVDD